MTALASETPPADRLDELVQENQARTAPVHRLTLEQFGEDFEVYRSGVATTLLCLRCKASKPIIGRILLTALADEAAAHADTCPGRED